MNKMILTAIGALGLLAGATWAFQFASSTTKENVIAARLEGQWTLNPEVTSRLDPSRALPPKTVEFVKNDRIVAQLRAESPRFQNEVIYMGGTVSIDGSMEQRFVVTCEYGNAHVVILPPVMTEPATNIMTVNVNMACSREPAKDMLFLGGDFARESAAAYDRVWK